MGTRPLRQHYGHGPAIEFDAGLAPDVEMWRRHRRRFVDAARGLREDQWKAPTRCSEWDTKDLLCHLITADMFWVISLGVVLSGEPPSTHLQAFDPSITPSRLVDSMRDRSYEAVLDEFAGGSDAVAAILDAMGPDGWAMPAESPMGHVPARLAFAHALWDSWTHERDVLVPLGLATPPEPDELLAVACYVLVMGGLQGGLLGDERPVGPGPDRAVTAVLGFDELPDDPLEVRYDQGVRVTRADPGASSWAAGSALAFIEGVTGRRPIEPASLPGPLLAQLTRASAVL